MTEPQESFFSGPGFAATLDKGKRRLLTLEQLKERRACPEQLKAFERIFGTSVLITPELCELGAAKFSMRWACSRLLSDAGYALYSQLFNARHSLEMTYQEVMDLEAVCFAEAYNSDGDMWEEVFCSEENKPFFDKAEPQK